MVRPRLLWLVGVSLLTACSSTQGALPTGTTFVRVAPPGLDRCGTAPRGSARAPRDAVVVDPAVVGDLPAKVTAAPPGSTFWLAPGTHRLGTGAFDQVQPKEADVFLGAPGAILDGGGVNRYAFTQHAAAVTVANLTVQHFVAPRDEGVVNHDSGDRWVIRDNVIQDNGGAGLMAGAGEQILGNCLRRNGQYGINAYQAGDHITDLLVTDNEITGNNTDDWESRLHDCGCTGGAKFWAVNGATIRHNWVHDNHGPGLWADTDDNDFLIEDNTISDNDGEALFYEISYNLTFRGNTVERNALVKGAAFARRGNTFPTGAVYLSESGGEPALSARTDHIEIEDNTFTDNWGGVIAWENPDRFCNSPANTSAGYCTRLVADPTRCSAPAIAAAPLYTDCRWRTRRVDVTRNRFITSQAQGCATPARMGLFSAYGTYPSWSPYRGRSIQDAVTFAQENSWHDNTYRGQWSFVVHGTDTVASAAAWQAAPYRQDRGSTFLPAEGGATC
jgi:parallel beta-helix repeat protein